MKRVIERFSALWELSVDEMYTLFVQQNESFWFLVKEILPDEVYEQFVEEITKQTN